MVKHVLAPGRMDNVVVLDDYIMIKKTIAFWTGTYFIFSQL